MTGTNASARRVLFISNGNGEDSVAVDIIRALPGSIRAEAFPIIGDGKVFDGICPLVGPRSIVPSQGWRHHAGSVSRDLKGGMLQGAWRAIRFLRANRASYDRVVVIGDGVGPLLCWLAGVSIDIYIDVFKSGYAHRYTGAERFLLARTAQHVFCRDSILADALVSHGIAAQSVGNIMMDCLAYGSYNMSARRQHPYALTLLPGSRVWAADALLMQIKALSRLPDEFASDLFLAVAPAIDPSELATQTGLSYAPPSDGDAHDRGTLSGQGLRIHLASSCLGNLLDGSDLVLAQAGTATQQAVGRGKPVITFNQPHNRPKRMADEQALMGDARLLVAPDPEAIANSIAKLLSDPELRATMGAAGQAKMGGTGTLSAVVALLAEGAP